MVNDLQKIIVVQNSFDVTVTRMKDDRFYIDMFSKSGGEPARHIFKGEKRVRFLRGMFKSIIEELERNG